MKIKLVANLQIERENSRDSQQGAFRCYWTTTFIIPSTLTAEEHRRELLMWTSKFRQVHNKTVFLEYLELRILPYAI